MTSLPLVHCCTHLKVLGGVQSVLRRHLKKDPALGIDSAALIFFERPPFPQAPVETLVNGLGLKWFNTGRQLRQRFKSAPILPQASAVWVYHDLWGMPTLADLDPSFRRIGILHSHWHGTEDLLTACDRLVDGVLCVSGATVDLARQYLPKLDPERIRWLPYPIQVPPEIPRPSRSRGSEIVIGYCGRIQRPQKRVERLPKIAAAIQTAKIHHRWEFLGDGPERGTLIKDFANLGIEASFHGTKSGPSYWQILSGWDVIIFSSDFEGLPISLLEALSRGVVPVFPDVNNGGRDYTLKVASELVYPAFDPQSAASSVAWLYSQPTEVRETLRSRAKQAAELHCGDAYDMTFSKLVSDVANTPRVSLSGTTARASRLGEYLPYASIPFFPPAGAIRRGYA